MTDPAHFILAVYPNKAMTYSESRRRFLNKSSLLASGVLLGSSYPSNVSMAFTPDATQPSLVTDQQATILMPRDRVPLSFIIDDSTCLVNMGHFCTPQFAACYPQRAEYQKAWKIWPREIPDSFVRQFGQWCAENGVKGKYSIVPNPACVGWLDRELPGWSKQELQQSLDLVRDLMLPNWDIHPEMITHTRVIDLKTGRPLEEISPATMENSYPQSEISVDQLAEYLAYALRILKNCGLPCEGITTPGGFGNRVKAGLPIAVRQAIHDVFPEVEIPHYFKYVELGTNNTEPRMEGIEAASEGIDRFTINVPAGTGDWFGGWQGDTLSQAEKYASDDAMKGRMIELIANRKPAVMLCHWPGIYSNGTLDGFHAFQRVVRAIASRFADETQWMKVSEMARYWAVKQTANVNVTGNQILVDSKFACPQFTIEFTSNNHRPEKLTHAATVHALERVDRKKDLKANTYWTSNQRTILCIDLSAGVSQIAMTTDT